MRIASFDGGGIRGVLEARTVERLEQESPWLAKVDLFAGTSTGGILALALAAGLDPGRIIKLYQDHGVRIFAGRDLLDVLAGRVDEVLRANYAQDGLRVALEETFGQLRLRDLQRDVLVPAFDLVHWRPKFFDRQHDGHELVLDVALSTSAAPFYLPVHKGKADGGIVANNPSDSALSHVVSRGVKLEDVRLLSFGAGAPVPEPDHDVLESQGGTLDWGAKRWALDQPCKIVEALFDGSVLTSHFRSETSLGPAYRRIQPALPRRIALDQVDEIPLLLAIADGLDLKADAQWLRFAW